MNRSFTRSFTEKEMVHWLKISKASDKFTSSFFNMRIKFFVLDFPVDEENEGVTLKCRAQGICQYN